MKDLLLLEVPRPSPKHMEAPSASICSSPKGLPHHPLDLEELGMAADHREMLTSTDGVATQRREDRLKFWAAVAGIAAMMEFALAIMVKWDLHRWIVAIITSVGH